MTAQDDRALAAAVAEARRDERDRAVEIVEACNRASQPDQASRLIRSNATLAEVRERLQPRQAADGSALTLQRSTDEALEVAAATRFAR